MPLKTITSYQDVKKYVLKRAGELDDGTSDMDLDAESAIVLAWKDLTTRYPWLSLMKNPPGVFLTTAPETTYTLTVAAGLASVGVLSASYPTSLVGRKILPGGGRNYYMRITGHAAPSANVTLDAAPEALAAQAITIYQDEYDLSADIGCFVNGLWTVFGNQIEMKSEEFLRSYAPGPITSSTWPAKYFSRISQTRIRLSSYSPQAFRVEYPYTYEPDDPGSVSITDPLAIEPSLRPVLAQGSWAELMDMKSDSRAAMAKATYEASIARSWIYDSRRHNTVFGALSGEAQPGLYR